VAEVRALIWTWPSFSIEMREGRVFSIRASEPAPPQARRDESVAHLQSSPRGSPQGGEGRGRRQSLDDAAAPLAKAGLVAERGAIADIAWPADVTEADALGRHAVVRVIAASRAAAELPMRRVYVHADSAPPLDLVLIGRPTRSLLDPGSLAGRVFGLQQEDAFFLLPIASAGCSGDVSIDFAQTRIGFSVTMLPASPPSFLVEDEYREPAKPSADALKRFIQREWPTAPLPDPRQVSALVE